MGWAVARTRPRMEDWAVMNLQEQGFNTMLPVIREHHSSEVTTRVMFPSYVFVEVDLSHDRWKSIHSTRGVVKIFTKTADAPAIIPESWISWMLAMNCVLEKYVTAASFKKGDELRFIDGPFKDHIGRCAFTAKDRVALLLNMLGREMLVYSSVATLRPVSDEPVVNAGVKKV